MKVFIVFSDLLFELVVETGPGVRTSVFLQDRLQSVTQSIFQAFKRQRLSAFAIISSEKTYFGWPMSDFEGGLAMSEVGREEDCLP